MSPTAPNDIIATSAIGLIPTVKGLEKNIGRQLTSPRVMSQTASAGRSIGSRMVESISKSLKTGVKLTFAGIGALGATAVAGGISRQLNVEDAAKKMESLGQSASDVAKIMGANGPVLKSVKGTAFALDDAATVASGAMAAGVDPAKDLESYLKRTADAATIAGVGMGEMGFVLNKVQTSQVAYTEDLNMLADRGIPIFQWLQDEYGVTAQELKKMVSEGKVDAATYFKVIDKNIGGAALKSGETTRGAFKNMLSALSRVGVALTSGIFPLFRTAFNGIGQIFDALTPKITEVIGPVFERFGEEANQGLARVLSGIATWVSKADFSRISGMLLEVAGSVRAFFAAMYYNDGDVTSSGLAGFMEQLGYATRQVFDVFRNADYSGFAAFFSSLGSVDFSGVTSGIGPALAGIGGGLGKILSAAPTLVAAALDLLGDALQFVAEHIGIIAPLIPAVVGGLLLWRGATQASAMAQARANLIQARMIPLTTVNNALILANTIAERGSARAKNASAAATSRATIAERARTVATKLGTIASKAGAAAVRLFGTALKIATGPIGWIIAGVTLLGTAIWLFFTKTDAGKELWSKIWAGIKGAIDGVVSWFMTSAVPFFQSAWTSLTQGVMSLWRDVFVPAWDGIKNAIGAVVDWVMGSAVPFLQSAWATVAESAMWLWKNVIEPAWTGIHFAIALTIAVIMTIVDGFVWIFRNVVAPMFTWLWQSVITPVWNGIKLAIAVAIAAVMTYVDAWVAIFKNVVAPVFTWLWKSVIEPVWAGIKGAIGAVVSWFQNTAWPVISVVIGALKTAFTWLWQSVIVPVWNGIKSAIQAVVSWFQTVAWPMVSRVISWLQNAFNWLWRGVITPVWNGIRAAISAVVQWFQGTAWPIISRVIGYIKTAFNVMKDAVGKAWSWVRDKAIRPVTDWLSSTVWPKIKSVTDNIKNAFNIMKDAVGRAWNGIKEAAKAPINFVINTVYNKGIKGNFDKIAGTFGLKKLPSFSGFARGGILPGFSRMRDGDDQLIAARRGEGWMVSEALRTAKDRALFLAANAAGRRGVGFADYMAGLKGFAGGGILDKAGSVAGDVLDGGKKLLKGAWDFVSDPVGAFKGLVGGLFKKIPGAGFFKDLALGVGRKILDGVVSKVQSVFSPAGNPDAAPVSVPPGGSRSLGYAQAVARRFGLTMTSFRRGGARTAGSGMVSLHALGRAMDFSNGVNTPQMMGFFNAMHPLRPTELLYSPAGSRQWRRSGRMADTSGVTKRMHYNHVHVGFAKGGIIPASIIGGLRPTLYDSGGAIPPGLRLIANNTGRPEKVLPPEESEALTRLAKSKISDGPRFYYQPQQVDLSEEVSHRTRREFEAMMHEARKVVHL